MKATNLILDIAAKFSPQRHRAHKAKALKGWMSLLSIHPRVGAKGDRSAMFRSVFFVPLWFNCRNQAPLLIARIGLETGC